MSTDGYFEITEEQERIQKKTFTNWINSYLAKAVPPDYMRDLFVDIRDGVKLIRLLEVLAGVRLSIERAAVMQRAHYLSNVKTALDFLTEERKIKLVNINPADVVDAKPAIVLGLIWSIILSFSIDEHEEVLHSVAESVEQTKKAETEAGTPQRNGENGTTNGKTNGEDGQNILPAQRKKALLAWVSRCIAPSVKSLDLKVRDFGPSWRDGVAFCALVHNISAESLDLRKIRPTEPKVNLEMAFSTAEQRLGIPRLLDVDDVDVDNPDERSIMTYIAQFLREFPTGKMEKRPDSKFFSTLAPGAKSLEGSLDAVDSAIDPSLVLSASTVSLHHQKNPPPRERLTTATTALDDEGIRSLLAATSSSLSVSEGEEAEGEGAVHQTDGGAGAQSMPNISASGATSPRRQGRARTYADLRLARVAKTYSRCRAIANIRVTADRTEETKNAVKIIHIENQIKDSNTQAEEERNFVIHITELISRIRHEPLKAQDLMQELQDFYEAEQQHKSLTTCLVEMGKRKKQGILVGILPSELAEIEAKWTQVKPELDEWRWRLDESLPGDWATVGRWLGQLERCLSAGSRLAVELDAASSSEVDAATRRKRFGDQLADLEERIKDKERMSELLGLLVKTNAPDEPSALPATVVNAIKKRFRDVCREAETWRRRTTRLYLRWKLADEITTIVAYVNELKHARFQQIDEVVANVEGIQTWKASRGLPEAMDADIESLAELCKDSETDASSSSGSSAGEQPGAGLLSIQIRAGGGTLIMRDVAETERAEAAMFLSSFRLRWAEALEDLRELEKSSRTLVETWRAYETETQTLHAWMQEAETKLHAKGTSNAEKRYLLSQVKNWRDRLDALKDLSATLIGQSTNSTGQAINTELASILQKLDNISHEVERRYQAESLAMLKRDFETTMGRMNDMLQAAADLLNKEVLLPQTTSLAKAEEATQEYRMQLKAMKQKILKDIEFEYNLTKELTEKMMAAAKDGEIDIAEAQRYMDEAERLRSQLKQMAEERIDNRLSELAMATREAVSLAVRLAQMSEWIEEAETVTNVDLPTTSDEIMLDTLAAFAPDEAIRRLQKHCNSINAQTKALEEAEGRLEELKAKGLKSVNISELETALSETRDRIKVMLEQTRKREQLLLRQSQTREATLKAADSFETWMKDAEQIVNASQESMLPLNLKAISEASRITQWSLEKLEQQRNAHETFCDERLAQGSELLKSLDETFDTFKEAWPQLGEQPQHASEESEIVMCEREVVARVETLRGRYKEVVERSPKALLTVRFVIIDLKIGEKLMEASERLRQEELRIESGEEVSSVLSEHEAYFMSADFVEELPALVVEMEHILEELVKLEPDFAKHYAKRTEVRGKTLFQLKGRAERFAISMRELPEKWLDFDAKLAGLEQWTGELEELANHLCSEGVSPDVLDPEVAAEVSRRYREMLDKFEEMADATTNNISMAERLNRILQELIAEGGLSHGEIASRRASLARVLNSLHDLEAMTPNVRQTAEKTAESLERQVAVAIEAERAKRMRTHMEEMIPDTGVLQSLDSDEMRRLMAEREALITRVNEEKKTSLAYLMQVSTNLDTSQAATASAASGLQMGPPGGVNFLQVWEDADRMMEEKAANLRTATQASEEFEEVQNRLFSLLGGAKSLLMHGTTATGPELDSAMSHGVPISSLKAYGTFAGDSEALDASKAVENIAGLGPQKLQEHFEAIKAHLRSLDLASADIVKLRAAADLIAEQLGAEKAAELSAIIDQLEKDIELTKAALAERLDALEKAKTRWVEIRERTRRLEDLTEAQKTSLADLRSQLEKMDLDAEEGSISDTCVAYKAYLERFAQTLSTLQSEVSDLSTEIGEAESKVISLLTVERVAENGNVIQELVEDVDAEVTEVRSVLSTLLIRQKGIFKVCQSLDATLQNTLAAVDEYSQLSGTVEAFLGSVENTRGTLAPFSDLEGALEVKEQLELLRQRRLEEIDPVSTRIRELNPYLKRVPLLSTANAKLVGRMEGADDWLSTYGAHMDALITDWRLWTNGMEAIEAELQGLEDVEGVLKELASVDEDEVTTPRRRRANQVSRQLETLRVLKARWHALRPQTETLISRLVPPGTDSLPVAMESTDHAVPRRYAVVGDQIKGLFTMLQQMNTKLESELDEQDRFANDVERLVHMVSAAEKRLAKITGIWIPSVPLLMVPPPTAAHQPTVLPTNAQSQTGDSKPSKDSESKEKTLDGYMNLTEARAELKSLFSEISGPMCAAIDSLLSRVNQFDTEESTAKDRLNYLLREISILGLRVLKRQYICEVSLSYEQARGKWFGMLRGLRSLQEQLLQTGATVEILSSLPNTSSTEEATPKPLKTLPVDLGYQEDCVGWVKSLNAAKVEILGFRLSSDRPKIPENFQEVETEVRFEPEYTPQELDTASIAAGIFFVTGRREELLTAATNVSSLEPFSFYVDVGRLISDCDRLKGGMVSHWNSLDVYCSNWLRFRRASEELATNTTDFLEKTLTLVRSAVELTDTRLDRPGNHKRLSEISTQFRSWQKAFAAPEEVENLDELLLVSRVLELKKDGEKLIELVPSRTMGIRTQLEANQTVLMDASIRLCEIAYQLERLVRAYDGRETAIQDVNSVMKEVEQEAGFRSVSSLAANLLGIDISPEMLAADELVGASNVKMEMSYKSDLEGLLQRISSSQDLGKLLAKLSRARTFLRAHLPPKLMQLQQSSAAAICAFDAIMKGTADKPSVERLEEDTIRNRIVTRCNCLSDILDDSIKSLEVKHQTMTLVETNISNLSAWMDELVPRMKSATHLLSVSSNESAIPEAIQFVEVVEDPADLLEIFKSEKEHYSKLLEITQLEVDSDREVLCALFESQLKSIATRFGDLLTVVSGMEELWEAYLAQDNAVNRQLSRESDLLKVLIERLEKINLQSGPALQMTSFPKERLETMEFLSHSFEGLQQIRSEYIEMIARVEDLSNLCFNRDTFRMHLKHRKLLRDQMADEDRAKPEPEKTIEQTDSLSKICANLSFRLASVDTQIKRCAEGICKRMTKVQADAATVWSSSINTLSENVEKLGSFAELPLLLKPERRDAVPSFFADRKTAIQESQSLVESLEAELSCIVDLYRMVQRFAQCDCGPSNTADTLGDEAFGKKKRTMLVGLRQNLLEYSIHVEELQTLLSDAFMTSSRVETALGTLDNRLVTALNGLEQSWEVSRGETALAQFSSIKNDLEPIRAEMRALQTHSDQCHSTLKAAITKGSVLLAFLDTTTTSPTPSSKEGIWHFTGEISAFEKRLNWATATLEEAEGRISALISAALQYEHRSTQARSWLHQSEVSLKSKSEAGGARSKSFDKEEAEMHLNLIQNLVLAFNDGKRLVDVMEGSATDLLTEAAEISRWVGITRQSPHYHTTSPHPVSTLPQFRDGVLTAVETMKANLAAYLGLLNSEKVEAETKLASCSSFCDNCARFLQWVEDCEGKWSVPAIGEKDMMDGGESGADGFLWEKQAIVSTCKQRLNDIQVHESLLKELFTNAELDYEVDGPSLSGSSVPVTTFRLIDARKRFKWLQKCIRSRLTSAEAAVKLSEEKDARMQVFRRSVEGIHRRFTTLEWEVVELATWEKLQPVTSEPILEMVEEVVLQLSESLKTITGLARDLEAAMEGVNNAPSSPRLADETKEILVRLRALRVSIEGYIKACLGLSNTYRTLTNGLSKCESRISEKAYLVELTSPDVCRLGNEEWVSLRNNILVEQSVLWQIEEELKNDNLDTKFSAAESDFEEFLTAIGEIARTPAPQCSAATQIREKMRQLREEVYAGCKKSLSDYQKGLEAQLSKGDLYHDKLSRCQDLLNAIEADLGAVLSSASLRGDVKTWAADTQDLVGKVTALERRLCDFQTAELENLMVVAQSGEEYLPLAAQAVQDRWSDLVNRAMTARGNAESALSAIQDAAEAFTAMLGWIHEAQERLVALLDKPFEEPSKSVMEAEEPRFMADGWNSLLEARSHKLSKLTKLHSESVTRRKVVLSTTEELGKLKGLPPSKAEASVIRALELELADAYGDLIEHCQSAVSGHQETLKTTQAAAEDAVAALNATEKLSDRANSLLFRNEFASASLDWQQTCLRDFLSIELATVRELVERARVWVEQLPQPDAALARRIAAKLTEAVAEVEERITERLGALEGFLEGLNEVSAAIADQEAWQRAFAADMNPAFRESPDTLERKRDMVKYFEDKLTEVDNHLEGLKTLEEDLENLGSNEATGIFSSPPEILSHLQSLRQSMTLQRQTTEAQRNRWFQSVDQHIQFLQNLISTNNCVSRLAEDSGRGWSVFQDVCRTAPPSLEMISWTREATICPERLGELKASLKQLNETFSLICTTESGSESHTGISRTLRSLNSFLGAFEEVGSKRLVLLENAAQRVTEFTRSGQRFTHSLDGFSASLCQLLGAETEPTSLVFQMMLEDLENGVSADLESLEKEKTAIGALLLEACGGGMRLPPLEPIDEVVMREAVGLEVRPREEAVQTRMAPDSRTFDIAKVVEQLAVNKAALVGSIKKLYEAADAVAAVRRQQRRTRKSCQDWLAEASKQLESCRTLMIEHSSSHSLSLEQKTNSLRVRQRNIEVLLETHRNNEKRFRANTDVENDLLTAHSHLLDLLKEEGIRRGVSLGFPDNNTRNSSADAASTASSLHSEWNHLLTEMQALQEFVLDRLARCEEASGAVFWMAEWLRSLERRIMMEEVSSMESNIRPALTFPGGHSAPRAYASEMEKLGRMRESQKEVVVFWQSLDEEITTKKPDFDEQELRITAIQSDSDVATQNYHQRLQVATDTVKSALYQNRQGGELLDEVCQKLTAYNTWIQAAQERSSIEKVSLTAILTEESGRGLEQGQEYVSSLVSAINRLTTECRWAREKLCPLSAAALLSNDLLSHLNVVWQSLRGDVQALRLKNQTDREALTEFSEQSSNLCAWMREEIQSFEALKIKITSHARAQESKSFAEELNAVKGKLPPVEKAGDNLVLGLKRKEQLLADASTLLNQLDAKNHEVETLRGRMEELGSLKMVEKSLNATEDTKNLLEEYATTRQEVKKLCDEAKEVLVNHQNLVKTSRAFQTWRDELKQALLSASNFSGDRYTLLARSDWMNSLDSIRQKGEHRSNELKESCARCLETSPADLASSLLAVTHDHLEAYSQLCDNIDTTYRHYDDILKAWKDFDKAAADFDSRLQQAQTSLLNYESTYCEDPSSFRTKMEVLSRTMVVLNSEPEGDNNASRGLCSDVAELKASFAQLTDRENRLAKVLGEVQTPLDSSVTSAVTRRSNELSNFTRNLEHSLIAWTKVANDFTELSEARSRLERKITDFSGVLESLSSEAEACRSVEGLVDIKRRCEDCLGGNKDLPEALKDLKARINALTPNTNNATVLQFRENLNSLSNNYSSIQQKCRSLIKSLIERVERDAQLKAVLIEQGTSLSESEAALSQLMASGWLSSNLPLPRFVPFASLPASEMRFSYAKFSNMTKDYLNQQKQCIAQRNEQISSYREDLLEKKAEIESLIGQFMLDDESSSLTKSAIKRRLDELLAKTDEFKQLGSLGETFISELTAQWLKCLVGLGDCLETFLQEESDSRRISEEDFATHSEKVLNNLNALSTSLKEVSKDLCSRETMERRLPTNDKEWRDFVGVSDVLMDEIVALQRKVKDLSTIISEETKDLSQIEDLHQQISALHSAHTAKLDLFVEQKKTARCELDISSEEKVLSQLNDHMESIKSARNNLKTTVEEYTQKMSSLLTSLSDTVKAFSSHRKQPVGILLTRLESQKVLTEDADRQASRLERELAEEIEKWVEFLGHLKNLQQWLRLREADFEAISKVETFAERTNALRSLSEALRSTGPTLVDKLNTYALRSMRSDLTIVPSATTWISERYNSLLKAVTQKSEELRGTVIAEEELRREADATSDVLDRLETQITEICGQKLLVSSPDAAIEDLEKRQQRLGDFVRHLEDLKTRKLTQLDEKVQSAKNRLKSCGYEQSELTDAVSRTAGLWNRYNDLRARSNSAASDVEKILKAGKDYYKLTQELESWLNEQKEAFETLKQHDSTTYCRDIHQLTDKLSNRSNTLHRFCMDLHSTGERHLSECSSSAAVFLKTVRSADLPLIQPRGTSNSTKLLTEENLLAGLQNSLQELHGKASRCKEETASMFLSLSSYVELFTSIDTWVTSVSKKVLQDRSSEDASEEVQLWTTPSSYLTIRTGNVLSCLAQSHERAEQIREKQAHLDVLLSRSKRLLDQWGSSEITRFAAQKAGALSRHFVELTTQVKKQIEQKTMIMRNIDRLQEARNAYTEWEKGVRGKISHLPRDEASLEALSNSRRLAKSLDMGDVLLEACRHWSFSVQSDALGSKTSLEPALAQDLISSYAALKTSMEQRVESLEKLLVQQRAKETSIASVSSWLEASEERAQAVLSSIRYTSTSSSQYPSFVSVMAHYERAIGSGISELSSLLSECSNQESSFGVDAQQLSNRIYAFKALLNKSIGDLEEWSKNLSAYRAASELVSIRQKLTLERYAQAIGVSTFSPESATQIEDDPASILEALLSVYDAERRLTMLKGVQDELVIDGRQLLESMMETADRLVTGSSMEQHDTILAEVVTQYNESLRSEQTILERLTKKSIELLECVTEAWKVFSRREEELSDWLWQMEQTTVRPAVGKTMSVEERRRILVEIQAYQASLEKNAALVERHLNEAEQLDRKIPRFQLAERARQLVNRFNVLVNSVQTQIDQNSGEISELSRFEGLLSSVLMKVEDQKSLLEECWIDHRFINRMELVSKQILIKKLQKELTDFRASSDFSELLRLTDHIKAHFSSSTSGEDITRRVAEVSAFLDESTRRLDSALSGVTARLESWEKWSALCKKLGEVLEKADAAQRTALKDSKKAHSNNAAEILQKRREAMDKLQELQDSLASKKPEFNELRRLMKATDAEKLDPLLHQQSNEILARHKSLLSDIQTQRSRLKRSWENLFGFFNKVSAADQWLLGASVKLTALNGATPDGPKSTAFLARSCDSFIADVIAFTADKLEPLLAEGREIETARGSSRKGRKGTSTTGARKQLIGQLERMKEEAEGLVQVAESMKSSLQSKMEEWEELAALVESGEAFVNVSLPRWWGEVVVDNAITESIFTMTPPLCLRMVQESESVFKEVVDQIRDVERRRFDLESACSKVTAPWNPVKTPSALQRRLQGTTVDEIDLTSSSTGLESPQTTGGLLRARVETLLGAYFSQVEKMKTLSSHLNNWRTQWDQQVMCENEFADWLQSKETETSAIFSGRGFDTPDLGTAPLKRLHSELLAKREVLDELDSWRQNLQLPAADNDTIADLRSRLDHLVERVSRRIDVNLKFEKQAREAAQVKTEVQRDLELMVNRMSRAPQECEASPPIEGEEQQVETRNAGSCRGAMTAWLVGLGLTMLACLFAYRNYCYSPCGAGFEAELGIRFDAVAGQPIDFTFPLYQFPPPM